jgi:alkylhydroperoxidase family enzyme
VSPRLPPLPKQDWDEEVRAALSQGSAALLSGDWPNAVTTMLYHPRLAGGWLAYNGALLREPALGTRSRELVVLRVAWRTASAYEWRQHVKMAPRYGITPEEVEAVTRGDDGQTWTPHEADLLAATDQLLDRYCIDDPTWARLRDHLDERQLVELVFIVGTYTCLAMAFNSFQVDLDPDLEAVAAPALPQLED